MAHKLSFPSPPTLTPAGHVFICICIYFPGARCGIVIKYVYPRRGFFLFFSEEAGFDVQVEYTNIRGLVRLKTCFSALASCQHNLIIKCRLFTRKSLYTLYFIYNVNIYSQGRDRGVKYKCKNLQIQSDSPSTRSSSTFLFLFFVTIKIN